MLIFSAFIGVLLYVTFTAVNTRQNYSRNSRAQELARSPAVATSGAIFKKPLPKVSPEILEKYLTVEAVLLGLADHYSVYYKSFATDTEVSANPTRAWIPASVIKSFVIPEAFRQRRIGQISFDQVVTIRGENVVSTALETDDYPRLREGIRVTIKQLLYAMITQSDNSAYNTLLDILDRRNINDTLRTIGITQTVVGEKLNLDDGQFQRDLTVAGRQPNTTTAKDLATFFTLLYENKIPDSDEIISIFKKQKFNNMIPALLPSNTIVAHKTGVWEPLEHDAGIVYKPDDPFAFIAFTNLGDPTQVAKLARIAYFQTADSVGKNITEITKPILFTSNRPVYYLNPNVYSSVLGVQTQSIPTPITGEDLGISSNDFNINPSRINVVKKPLIGRSSIFYPLKKFIESEQVAFARSGREQVQINLQLSKNRLAEAKAAGEKGDVRSMKDALLESESRLQKATALAKSQPDYTGILVQIKQLSDLHYSLLQNIAEQTAGNQKELFINAVYSFHQEHSKKVGSILNTSFSNNPVQQKPIIGSVISKENNKVIVKLDGGSIRTILINDSVPSRTFGSKNTDGAELQVGSKIAVIGVIQSDSTVVPQFILKNVPKQLPNRHEGTVVEIDPNKNKLKLMDANGKVQTVSIDKNTILKSTDTSVSLEGIKIGSRLSVFGVSQTDQSPPQREKNSSSSATVAPTITLPGKSQHKDNRIIINGVTLTPSVAFVPYSNSSGTIISVAPVQTGISTTPKAALELKATSIKVTNNSSGSNEKIINTSTQKIIIQKDRHTTTVAPTLVKPQHSGPVAVPPTSRPAVTGTKQKPTPTTTPEKK